MTEIQAIKQVEFDRDIWDILYSTEGLYDLVREPTPLAVYDENGWYTGTLDADGEFHPQEL